MIDDDLIENICDMVELNRHLQTFPQNDDDTRSCRSNPDDILCSSEFNLSKSPKTRRSNHVMMSPGTTKRRSKSQNRRRGGRRRNGMMRSISSIFSDSSCSTTAESSRRSSMVTTASSIRAPSPPVDRFAYQRKKASRSSSPIQKLVKHMRSSDHM